MNDRSIFGALRTGTLTALCAGGLVLATAGCMAESPSGAGSGTGDGATPAKVEGEKSCGEKACGENSNGEKSCG